MFGEPRREEKDATVIARDGFNTLGKGTANLVLQLTNSN